MPMMVRHSVPTPSVVVQSETAKNKHYAELLYPDNPPIVPPPCDTVVVYSQVPHHLQVNMHLSLLMCLCVCKSELRVHVQCTSTIVKYFILKTSIILVLRRTSC